MPDQPAPMRDELLRLVKAVGELGCLPGFGGLRELIKQDLRALAERAGPLLVDTTIARHIAEKAYGAQYGVDWVYHCDRRGVLSEREAFASERAGGVADGWRNIVAELIERDGGNDCKCIYHSRKAESEYEQGKCPHQRARAMLAAPSPDAQHGAQGVMLERGARNDKP